MDYYAPLCPESVHGPAFVQDREPLTFLHWPVDAEAVQRLLPTGLRPDLLDGSAWVELVPFFMRAHTGPRGPLPFLSTFPETNVRTW